MQIARTKLSGAAAKAGKDVASGVSLSDALAKFKSDYRKIAYEVRNDPAASDLLIEYRNACYRIQYPSSTQQGFMKTKDATVRAFRNFADQIADFAAFSSTVPNSFYGANYKADYPAIAEYLSFTYSGIPKDGLESSYIMGIIETRLKERFGSGDQMQLALDLANSAISSDKILFKKMMLTQLAINGMTIAIESGFMGRQTSKEDLKKFFPLLNKGKDDSLMKPIYQIAGLEERVAGFNPDAAVRQIFDKIANYESKKTPLDMSERAMQRVIESNYGEGAATLNALLDDMGAAKGATSLENLQSFYAALMSSKGLSSDTYKGAWKRLNDKMPQFASQLISTKQPIPNDDLLGVPRNQYDIGIAASFIYASKSTNSAYFKSQMFENDPSAFLSLIGAQNQLPLSPAIPMTILQNPETIDYLYKNYQNNALSFDNAMSALSTKVASIYNKPFGTSFNSPTGAGGFDSRFEAAAALVKQIKNLSSNGILEDALAKFVDLSFKEDENIIKLRSLYSLVLTGGDYRDYDYLYSYIRSLTTEPSSLFYGKGGAFAEMKWRNALGFAGTNPPGISIRKVDKNMAYNVLRKRPEILISAMEQAYNRMVRNDVWSRLSGVGIDGSATIGPNRANEIIGQEYKTSTGNFGTQGSVTGGGFWNTDYNWTTNINNPGEQRKFTRQITDKTLDPVQWQADIDAVKSWIKSTYGLSDAQVNALGIENMKNGDVVQIPDKPAKLKMEGSQLSLFALSDINSEYLSKNLQVSASNVNMDSFVIVDSFLNWMHTNSKDVSLEQVDEKDVDWLQFNGKYMLGGSDLYMWGERYQDSDGNYKLKLEAVFRVGSNYFRVANLDKHGDDLETELGTLIDRHQKYVEYSQWHEPVETTTAFEYQKQEFQPATGPSERQRYAFMIGAGNTKGDYRVAGLGVKTVSGSILALGSIGIPKKKSKAQKAYQNTTGAFTIVTAGYLLYKDETNLAGQTSGYVQNATGAWVAPSSYFGSTSPYDFQTYKGLGFASAMSSKFYAMMIGNGEMVGGRFANKNFDAGGIMKFGNGVQAYMLNGQYVGYFGKAKDNRVAAGAYSDGGKGKISTNAAEFRIDLANGVSITLYGLTKLDADRLNYLKTSPRFNDLVLNMANLAQNIENKASAETWRSDQGASGDLQSWSNSIRNFLREVELLLPADSFSSTVQNQFSVGIEAKGVQTKLSIAKTRVDIRDAETNALLGTGEEIYAISMTNFRAGKHAFSIIGGMAIDKKLVDAQENEYKMKPADYFVGAKLNFTLSNARRFVVGATAFNEDVLFKGEQSNKLKQARHSPVVKPEENAPHTMSNIKMDVVYVNEDFAAGIGYKKVEKGYVIDFNVGDERLRGAMSVTDVPASINDVTGRMRSIGASMSYTLLVSALPVVIGAEYRRANFMDIKTNELGWSVRTSLQSGWQFSLEGTYNWYYKKYSEGKIKGDDGSVWFSVKYNF
jgi:hypothetical protein